MGPSAVLKWWAIVWGPVALVLLGVGIGILPFGIYLIVLLVAALSAILSAIILALRYGAQRRWPAVAIVALLPAPLLLWWPLVDVGVFCADWSYFQSNREAYQSCVASLPVGQEPRFLRLESASLGSALTGPIERSIVYDESGRIAGPKGDEAALFRANFYPDGATADYCVRFQQVRSLGNNFYVIRGVCEF